MKTNKVNKLKKATSKVAFLFACAIVASPCITSLQSCATTSEEIHSEVIISNNMNEVNTFRTNKTMKRANNLNDLTKTELIGNVNYDLQTLQISYSIAEIQYGPYSIDTNLDVIYNYGTDIILSNELYIEVFDAINDFLFEQYYEIPKAITDYITSTDYIPSADEYITFEFSQYAVGMELYFKPLNLVDDPIYSYGFDLEEATDSFYAEFKFASLKYEIDNIFNLITDVLKKATNKSFFGALTNYPLEFGLWDFDNEDFIERDTGFVSLENGLITALNGGFKVTDWTYYENANIEDYDSKYGYAIRLDFGTEGVLINDIDKLYPIDYNNIPRLGFGQQLIIKTLTKTFTWSGADEGPIQYIDFNEFQNGILKKELITSISFIGNGNDYIPYGLSTNTDYSIGYDNGYDRGFTSGVLEGRKEGYENGFNDGKLSTGTSYQDGYTKGFNDAKNQYQNTEALSFEDVLTAVITTPSKIIKDGFDFDILGINVGSLLQTAIVIALIVFAIGMFKKG